MLAMVAALAVAQVDVDAALADPELNLVGGHGALVDGGRERDAGALGPAVGAVRRRFDRLSGRRQAGANVERHLDVGTDQALDAHRVLRGQPMLGPVVGRGERGSVLVDRGLEGEDLEPAGVGEQVAVPPGEPVEPASLGHQFGAGAQHQVVGVAQHDPGAQGCQVAPVQRTHRTPGTHGHETRRGHRPSGCMQRPGPGVAVGSFQAEQRRPHRAPSLVNSMASPKDRNR